MTRDEVNAARIAIARERLEVTKRRLALAERKQAFFEARADVPRVHVLNHQKLPMAAGEDTRTPREILRARFLGED